MRIKIILKLKKKVKSHFYFIFVIFIVLTIKYVIIKNSFRIILLQYFIKEKN